MSIITVSRNKINLSQLVLTYAYLQKTPLVCGTSYSLLSTDGYFGRTSLLGGSSDFGHVSNRSAEYSWRRYVSSDL